MVWVKHFLSTMTTWRLSHGWLLDYEFVDDLTVKITLRDGVKFSSGRAMDAQAVKECLEDLISVHDRAPYDLKIDHIEADGQILTIYTTEPCPAIINYLGDPYGAIIDMEYGIQGEGGSANVAGTGPLHCYECNTNSDRSD